MLSFDKARLVFSKKGYQFFDGNQPYNLNIIGIRTGLKADNHFDDLLAVLYRDDQLKEQCFMTTCTTKPGLYYMEHPMNASGTGILPEGQYRSTWQIGLHKGEYEALVQCKPLKIFRDNNHNDTYDLDPNHTETGMWGLDIHRANPAAVSTIVDRWSAACQVMNNPTDFAKFMQLCHKSADLYGNSFTYTLLNSSDVA